MVIADILENFRAANRRVANVIACEVAAAAETAERDRQKAAVVVNALNATRTRQLSKPTGNNRFCGKELSWADLVRFRSIPTDRRTKKNRRCMFNYTGGDRRRKRAGN
jgi:hypothetical protein